MISLPNLKNLEILSLGRTQIKKVSLDGLHPCEKLHTLFMLDNRIKSWGELTKLTQLPEPTFCRSILNFCCCPCYPCSP